MVYVQRQGVREEGRGHGEGGGRHGEGVGGIDCPASA